MTLHTYTPNQCPYKISTSYALGMPRYSLDKILKFKVTTLGQRLNQGHIMTMHTYTSQAIYQPSTFDTLRIPRYSPDKVLKVKVVLWLNGNFGTGFWKQKFGEKPGKFDL